MDAQLNNLIMLLCRNISNSRLYSGDHPKLIRFADQFVQELQKFFKDTGEQSLFLGVIEGSIVYKGKNLVGPSIVGKQLVNFTENLCCGGISFWNMVTAKEIGGLLSLAAEINAPLDNLEEARQLLHAKDVLHITLGAPYLAPTTLAPKEDQYSWQGMESREFLASPSLIYQALFDIVSTTHRNGKTGRSLDIDTTRNVSEHLVDHTRDNFSDIMQHIHYPDIDTYTVGHSVRVASLAVYVGTTLNLPADLLLELGSAALLHDVGKSRIPEEILFKPDRLTAEEFSIIQEHSHHGVEILLAQEDCSELEIAGAWGHHIRHDGKGYPKFPRWAVRHPLTALLQICDVFEALTAVRPYKPPLSPQAAFSIMLADKGAFAPDILASFIRALGLFPPGYSVTLSDGSHGIVSETGMSVDRPLVKIMANEQGESLPEYDHFFVDLNQQMNHHLRITSLLEK